MRRQFPILDQLVNGFPLAYLDSATTTQKPTTVLDRMTDFYRRDNANVHRGLSTLSMRATDEFERARTIVASFLGASAEYQVIFTSGTTASLNLVARSYLAPKLSTGDNVVVSIMEHHSNFLPWQQLAKQQGAELRVATVDQRARLDLDHLTSLIDSRTRLVALVHVSNVLGVVNPVASVIELAHRHGVPVVIDGAQAVAHVPVDLEKLDADFYVFSGHKVYGPTGIGVLVAKTTLLHEMEPWQFGGEMVTTVEIDRSTWADPPARFEAGTPNVVGAVGLGAALQYVQGIGVDTIKSNERALTSQLLNRLRGLEGVTIIGPSTLEDRIGIVSFTVAGSHPHDLATVADEHGVAIRAGLQCAEPLHRFLGLGATARASLGVYSWSQDVDQLMTAIRQAQAVIGAHD
ncbi:SufS family cysteine desulfurase [Candidatus Berkelbacteria bacterium]|nr:SufS family cysteine desulfurase [Candidatus Berkelbacteria bacterium]